MSDTLPEPFRTMRERHRPVTIAYVQSRRASIANYECDYCRRNWPCDTHKALGAIEAQIAATEKMAKVMKQAVDAFRAALEGATDAE